MRKMFVNIGWLRQAKQREQLVNHFPSIHLERNGMQKGIFVFKYHFDVTRAEEV